MSVNTVDLAKLQQQYQNGGSWFYWIGVLSIVNAIIHLSGASWTFIFGLGVTQVVTAIAANTPEIGTVGKVVAFALTAFIAGICILFGILTKKGQLWAFVVGGILYLIDALILLPFADWLGLAFHVFVLYMIVQGFRAGLAIKRLPPEVLQQLLAQQQAAAAVAMQPVVAQAAQAQTPQAEQEQPK